MTGEGVLELASAAIAPGRIEAGAGRGSSAITFSLFDLDERDYDMLFASKFELLLAANPPSRSPGAGRTGADRCRTR